MGEGGEKVQTSYKLKSHRDVISNMLPVTGYLRVGRRVEFKSYHYKGKKNYNYVWLEC